MPGCGAAERSSSSPLPPLVSSISGGLPVPLRSMGHLHLGNPGQQMGEKRKSGLGALPGAVCTVCTPAPESHSTDEAELSAGRDAVGQGDESRARWRDAVG